MSPRPHVVIVGAGFGGLAAARRLVSVGSLDVTLVDQRNHHTFQPLLYQVATAGLDASDVCYPVRRFARPHPQLRSLQATVTAIDFDARRIDLDTAPALRFDDVILAPGAVTADFGVPGVADHAFGLKSAADAEQLRHHVLRSFDRAAQAGEGSGADTTIVVVGGGPTGVELAGGYAELTRRVLLPDYPELNVDDVRIILIEGRASLLGGFRPKLRDNARRTLERLGVEVRLDANVQRVDTAGVLLGDGDRIESKTVVWAAGVRAHPLADALDLATGPGGRAIVDDRLRVDGRSNVFAIGDFAATPTEDGPAAQVAAVAVQGGQYAADAIAARHRDAPEPEPFRYRDKGSMATIGRNNAVVELPNGFTTTGFVGWIAWLGLHLVMLMGFRNRASVFVNWAWNYLTYDRGSRVIIEPD
ncbi:MAG: NAD(P)/FAD-dependent oxidoreductase [Actinomycetota bacterium]